MPSYRDHLVFSGHMKAADFDKRIKETFLGQAHIAGTGPEGKTCRECVYWFKWQYDKERKCSVPTNPKRYGMRHDEFPGEPQKAPCNRPILNKAKRQVPHFAKACRLFEQNDNPMPVRIEE